LDYKLRDKRARLFEIQIEYLEIHHIKDVIQPILKLKSKKSGALMGGTWEKGLEPFKEYWPTISKRMTVTS